MLPASSGNISPPLSDVVERDISRGQSEHSRTGDKSLWIDSRIFLWIRLAFCDRDIARSIDELGELSISHRSSIHPKTIDRDRMNRLRVGHIAIIAAHREGPTWNPHHSFGCRARRITRVDAYGKFR